ncbi:MAG: c-type cytochrome [Bacteroidota bacterium]|nr:c-type cytochrome [Bacteroidota bacterium]
MMRSIFVLGILVTNLMPAQAQDVANGKSLFEGNCVSCHAIHEKSIGPALKGVTERREEAWLLKWVKNSTALIKSGDPVAVKLFNDYNKVAMNSFENFSDQDVKDILAYIKEESAKEPVVAAGPTGDAGTTTTAPTESNGLSGQTTTILMVLAGILILASVLLFRINSFLKELILKKFPERQAEEEATWYNSKFTPWMRSLNPTIASLVVVTVFMLAFGGWFFSYANTEIGVQQGYAPTQPINFSHKIHAGDHEIDCKYCHSSVEVSKQASVPAVSTCMNCHSYIDAKDKYNGEVSPEIQKIRTAYETNTPIKWVRIHNLPDHAYFNHAQHVSVGKVECQACHGPIETMDKVEQHSSLQMGWCVNCHRESKVDVANNDYYEQLHADLEKRGKRTITVAHNGGLECGKCHY